MNEFPDLLLFLFKLDVQSSSTDIIGKSVASILEAKV